MMVFLYTRANSKQHKLDMAKPPIFPSEWDIMKLWSKDKMVE